MFKGCCQTAAASYAAQNNLNDFCLQKMLLMHFPGAGKAALLP
jgi:hypothetical protein